MELEKSPNIEEFEGKESFQIWLEEGYAIFSEEGPSGIQIGRIAKNLGQSSSGIHHIFGDMDTFLELLMKMHLSRLDMLSYQIRQIKHFDPEFLNFLMANRETVLFQMQLVQNRENPLFSATLEQFSNRITAGVLPVWSNYLGTTVTVSAKLWGIIRETFYSRVRGDNFNFEWMTELSKEVRNLVRKE